MALTIVHLLAARRWTQCAPQFAAVPEFWLGAISPDAMHVRYRGDKSRKDEFHLVNWLSPHVKGVTDYWEKRFSPFDAGYGVHCLTDAQWVPAVREAYPHLYPAGRAPDVEQYYNDAIWTDFRLLETVPGARELLEGLRAAVPPGDHPLLTAEELARWRDETLEFYLEEPPRQMPVRSVTPGFVMEFIETCQPMLTEASRRFLP